MTHRPQVIARLCLGALLLLATPLFAQDEPAQAKPKPKPKAQAAPEELPLPVVKDPAVTAVLAGNPTTPAECFRAAKTLAGLDQPALAREMLAKVLAAKPDDAALVAIGENHGSAVLTSIANRADLQPEAQQVVKAILASLAKRARDPNRIADLVAKLADPQSRLDAAAELSKARSEAVGPLVDALAAAKSDEQSQPIRAMLIAMDSDAGAPLLSLIETAEPALAVQAIRVLGQMNYKPAKPFLLRHYLAPNADPAVRQAAADALRRMGGALPGKEEAVRILASQAREFFEGRAAIPREIDGQVEHWTVDAGGKFAAKRILADDMRRVWAARLAADAAALSPGDASLRALALAATLEEASYLQGRDKPLSADKDSPAGKAAAMGVPAVEDALHLALKTQHPAAAAAAARILGEIGKPDDLLNQGAMPSALVTALKYPDRRLRLAAAEAIVQLQPQSAFAGASYVVPALAFLAGSSGRPKAILAGPTTESLREMVGVLTAEGLLVDTAGSGRELLRMTAASPDYELAMFDVQIDQPAADMLLQQLRREPNSADLRVGIVASSGWFELADKVARHDGKAQSFALAHADKDFQWQIDQLKTIGPKDFVGRDERREQAARALQALAAIDKCPPKLFELSRAQDAVIQALYAPELGEKAVAVLGRIGTPDSQRALVEVASRVAQPLGVRKAAAKAFAENVKRSGILLTTEEIRRQYKRYNDGESLDSGSLSVLASILDTIEAPTLAIKQAAKKSARPAAKQTSQQATTEPAPVIAAPAVPAPAMPAEAKTDEPAAGGEQ